jgi:hypothetical protein
MMEEMMNVKPRNPSVNRAASRVRIPRCILSGFLCFLRINFQARVLDLIRALIGAVGTSLRVFGHCLGLEREKEGGELEIER